MSILKLPEQTVMRLSQYRRLLLRYQYFDKPYIFSKDLARMLKINPAHVRRDMMLMGFSGSHSKGYDVQKLIDRVSEKLECNAGKKACIIGFGHIGRAVLEMFDGGFTPVKVQAIFDDSPKSINKVFSDVPVYSTDKLTSVIEEKNIQLAILTQADENLENIKDLLLACGINGIMNLTNVRIDLPEHIHLEEFDMLTAMIKLAYFSEEK